MVRAKLQVTKHARTAHGNPGTILPTIEVTLTSPHNAPTPTGTIHLHVDDPLDVEALPLGKFFWVDFTPV